MTAIIRVNDEEYDRFVTGDMIHEIETCVAEITRYCTMRPGDIICMGSDGNPRNIKPGDVAEIEITGFGKLRNPVVAGQ